jgi:hypothetical protein
MLTDFIVTIGNVCIRRFQVVYPAALLLIPGLVFRGSDSGLGRALAWAAIGLAIVLVCAAAVARPTSAPCTCRDGGGGLLLVGLACGALAVGAGIASGRASSPAEHVATALLAIGVIGASACLRLAYAGRRVPVDAEACSVDRS